MTVRRELLELVVERSTAPGSRVTVAGLADRLGVGEATVREHLAALERSALVAIEEEAGVRPTVTGRELLDLADGADDLLVVDPVPDGEAGGADERR